MDNSSQTSISGKGEDTKRFTYYPVALSVMTTVFFMWGFLTCLNDILIPHLKTIFELNYAKAMLVQFTFFGAYFLMSIPGGKLVSALGYKKGIVTGLVIAAVGAFGFWPAAISCSYYVFLFALFVLATGITILQVAANPYVTLLGPSKTGSSRLNLAQAFNALGTTLAPYLGGLFILAVASTYSWPANIGNAPETVQLISTLTNDQSKEDITTALDKTQPQNVAYALKNVPPFVFDKLSSVQLLAQAKRLTPDLLGAILNDLPSDKKLFVLSHSEPTIIEQLPNEVLVQALDGFSTVKLSDQAALEFSHLKDKLTVTTKDHLQEYRNQQAKSVQIPYAVLGIVLLLLAGFVAIFKLPENQDDSKEKGSQHPLSEVFKYPHAILGAVGIFCYVGAEVSVGSFMVNYLSLPDIGRMTERVASQYVAYFWGGAMVGRIIGSALMVKISPRKMLSLCAVMNLILLITTMTSTGNLAMYSVIAVGLFNSIMFPTIFALAIEKMGYLTEQASSLVVMAIVGGAVIPFAQGFIADAIGLHHAFLLPLFCYLYILYYGISGSKLRRTIEQ